MATPAAPMGPPCPRCNAAGVWHPQLQQWGCDHCRQMLPPPVTPQAQAQPQRPACPQCGGPATFYPPSQWGCDRCRMAVRPVMPAGATSSAGAIVVKVLLFILMVGVIVAIKVGIRGAFR